MLYQGLIGNLDSNQIKQANQMLDLEARDLGQDLTLITSQGCAQAKPDGPWRLTFPFE